MSTFKVETAISITPKEVTTLADGSDTATTINSNLDKTYGSSKEFTVGTIATDVIAQENITVSATATLDTLVTGLGASDVVQWLYIRKESDAGEVGVSWFTSAADIGLWRKDDFLAVTLGDSEQSYFVTGSNITVTKVIDTSVISVFLTKARV